MRVLLDTNVYSALMRGAPAVEECLDQADEVMMSAIVLGELHAGFRGGSQYRKNARDLDEFLDDPAVKVLAVDEDTATVFGEVKQRLAEAGTPVPINDVWIAAQCIQSGSLLATYDAHFAHITGLRLWDEASTDDR